MKGKKKLGHAISAEIALHRAKAVIEGLSTDKAVQAEIMRIGAKAYAAGITEDMFDAFCRIAARRAVYRSDIESLKRLGVERLPGWPRCM